MAFPEFSGFSFQDINGTGFITSNIRKTSTPERSVETDIVSRRPGVRLLNDEFRARNVIIEGYVMGNSPSDLQSKLDSFNVAVTAKTSGQLAIDGGRTATAVVESVEYDENPYNTDFLPYKLHLLLTDPFFYGSQVSANFTLVSGTNTFTIPITISGSYRANPLISLIVDGTSEETLTKRIDLSYDSTGETITWSGSASDVFLGYGETVLFDFNTQLITLNTAIQNTRGAFADFEPGSRNITITFSGTGDWPGGSGSVSYQPRYL